MAWANGESKDIQINVSYAHRAYGFDASPVRGTSSAPVINARTRPDIREGGTIVEIDARALARTYGTIGQVPAEFWDFVASLGTSIIWLKCPWQESPLSFGLMQEYSRLHSEVLPGAKPVRIAGGFDVYKYELNPEVAQSDDEFGQVVKLLEGRGIKFILDFVTNHIAADSPYITEASGLVRAGDKNWLIAQARRFFPDEFKDASEETILQSLNNQFPSFRKIQEGLYIQHARMDAGSKGAKNLAQINYLDEHARRFMIDTVLDKIAKLTKNGGLRADLAHLAFRLVVRDFWGFGMSWSEFERQMPKEFWQEFKQRVDERYPGMQLFTETYKQGNIDTLMSLGFKPYNKDPYDFLVAGNMDKLRSYLLRATPEAMREQSNFLANCVHFAENHDEPAAEEAFKGHKQMLAASVILWSIPGYKMVPLRQILGMMKPEGAVLEQNKSADAGIYPFQYPDVTKTPGAVVPEIAEIMRFISLPVMRQGEMDNAPVQVKLAGNTVGRSQTGLVAFTRRTSEEHALVLVNNSWDQTVEVSVARSDRDILKSQCLSLGGDVQILEKEIKVVLSPCQYCLLSFGQLQPVGTPAMVPEALPGLKEAISQGKRREFIEGQVHQELRSILRQGDLPPPAEFLNALIRLHDNRKINPRTLKIEKLNSDDIATLNALVCRIHEATWEFIDRGVALKLAEAIWVEHDWMAFTQAPDFRQESWRKLYDEIVWERGLITKTTHQWGQAITVLGGARVRPGHPYYELGIKLGRAMARMGVPPRTGAGPGIMAAVLEGYLDEMKKKLLGPRNQTQGIKIKLPFEAEINEFVQMWKEYQRFLTRLDALEENSKGGIFLPGGFGTLNEVFDYWDKGIPMAFLGKKFWNPILKQFEKSLKKFGMEERLKYRISYLITDDPQEAVAYIISESKNRPRQRTTRDQFKVINKEMRETLERLEVLGRAVVVKGNPSHERHINLTRALIAHEAGKEGAIIRVASLPPVYREVLNLAENRGWSQRVHAVLYDSSKDDQVYRLLNNDWAGRENQLVVLKDKSNYLLSTAYNAAAFIFAPGAVGTFNHFFGVLTIMQTKKVRRRPIMLVGRDFWQPFFSVLKRQMLSAEFGGTCPDGLNMIAPDDLNIFTIVDDDNLPQDGPGCSGNVSQQNAKGINQLIAQKAYKEINVDQKAFEGIVDVPVKVYILSKQIPRAPPEGFIWDRLTRRGKDSALEIYYSSRTIYERNKDLLLADAYHGLVENRLLRGRKNKLTPAQAHTQAVEDTARLFPQLASRLTERFSTIMTNPWIENLFERDEGLHSLLLDFLTRDIVSNVRAEVDLLPEAMILSRAEEILQTPADKGGLRDPAVNYSAGQQRYLSLKELFISPTKGSSDMTQLLGSYLGILFTMVNGSAVALQFTEGIYTILKAIEIFSADRDIILVTNQDRQRIEIDCQPNEYRSAGITIKGLRSFDKLCKPADTTAKLMSLVNIGLLLSHFEEQGQQSQAAISASSRQPSLDEILFHDYFEDIYEKALELCVVLSRRMQSAPADLPVTAAKKDELAGEILNITLGFLPREFEGIAYKEQAGKLAVSVVRAVELINSNNEPAAFFCLLGVINRIDKNMKALLRSRLANRSGSTDQVKTEGRDTLVSQQRYQLLPGGRRTMLADSGSKFSSRWESFRGIVEAIESMLSDSRRMKDIRGELETCVRELQNGQDIIPGLESILEKLGDIALLHVEEKRVVWLLVNAALQMLKSGNRHWRTARRLLGMASSYADIRGQRAAIKANQLLANRLIVLGRQINGRNADLIRRFKGIRNDLKAKAARGRIYGALNLKTIKGEPDLGMLYGILWQALTVQAGQDIEVFSEQARAVVEGSSRIFKAWIAYVQALVDAELNGLASADRIVLMEKIFQQYSRGLPALERAIFRSRLYQAIFIPLKVNDAKSKKRVFNPVFKAAAFYQDVLTIGIIEKLMGWRLMSENTKENTFAFLRQVGRKHLIREDLPGLMTAITRDFKLNAQQGQALNGCVFIEPRGIPLTLPITYFIGYLLYWALKIGSAFSWIPGHAISIRRWIELEVAPLLEAPIFQWVSEERIMRWHGILPGDHSPIAERRRAGIRMIKEEIKKGYQYGLFKSLTNNILAHRQYNFKNPDAALSISDRSVRMTKEDTEKKRGEMIIALAILFMLFVLPLAYLFIKLTRPISLYRFIRGLMAPAKGQFRCLQATASSMREKSIQYGRCWLQRPASVVQVYKVYVEWTCKAFNGVFAGYPLEPVAPYCVFYPVPAHEYLNVILSTLLFYNWIYFRLLYVSIRVIFVTILKVVIMVSERQIVLDAESSMGTKPDSRGYWSGFFNLIPRFINIFTCNICYTSTTYEYTMIV